MDIIERIKKLYNLSTRNSSTEEAAAAAAKIQELCFKHELDLEKIIASGTDTTKKEAYERFDYMLPETCKTDVQWKRTLFDGVCRGNFCKAVTLLGSTKMALVGQKHNFEIVCYTYEYLSREIQRLAIDYCIQQGFLSSKDKRRYIAGFCEGATNAIYHKILDSLRQQQTADAESTALVVVKGRELETATASIFPHLRKGRSRQAGGSFSGFSDGKQAAAGISINRGVVSNGRRLIG